MAKQDTRRLSTLASLQLVRVQSEDGRGLGHVFDVRTQYDPARPEQPPVVTEIIYGTLGLLERMGVRRRRPSSVEWKSVLEVRPDVIVVRKKKH